MAKNNRLILSLWVDRGAGVVAWRKKQPWHYPLSLFQNGGGMMIWIAGLPTSPFQNDGKKLQQSISGHEWKYSKVTLCPKVTCPYVVP